MGVALRRTPRPSSPRSSLCMTKRSPALLQAKPTGPGQSKPIGVTLSESVTVILMKPAGLLAASGETHRCRQQATAFERVQRRPPPEDEPPRRAPVRVRRWEFRMEENQDASVMGHSCVNNARRGILSVKGGDDGPGDEVAQRGQSARCCDARRPLARVFAACVGEASRHVPRDSARMLPEPSPDFY